MSDRLLRRPEVEREIGFKRSQIYDMMKLPPEDPRHLPRPQRTGKRAVAWRQSDIEAWKRRQPQA